MIFLKVGAIEGYWRELLLALCKPIYQLIVYLYKLFETVSTADLLTNETITEIFNRISLILGIFMMFRITLSFVQMLINPDYISDKEKGIGNIVKKAFLVVILLGVTPAIFSRAMELQNIVVGASGGENVIAKIILPSGSTKQFDDFGSQLSAYLFTTFYIYDSDFKEELQSNVEKCSLFENYNGNKNYLENSIMNNSGNIDLAYNCLDKTFNPKDNNGQYIEVDGNKVEKYSIAFTSNGIFAVVVGVIICWMLLSYTLAAGVRVVQLVFLRVISPLAIMGYLSPKKDGIFEKWLKMCTTTYIDLFIRMAIIYFVLYIINLLIGDTGLGLAIYDEFEQMWLVNVVIIIALLIFAKKAPELLKELFPKGGAASLGYGLKSPKKMLDDMLFGSTINKGLSKGFSSVSKTIKKAPGNWFRQTMGRRDVIKHGGSWEEAKVKYPGFIGRKRINWMKENAPLAYKSYENKVAGNQELAEMHSNWWSGESIRKMLVSKYSTTPGFSPDKWADVFDGKNFSAYKSVYNNEEFAKNVMKVDFEKNKLKAFSAVNNGLTSGMNMKEVFKSLSEEQQDVIKEVYGLINEDGTGNMENYNKMVKETSASFYSKYEKQQKIVTATEKVHESLRKVHDKDADIEDQITFRKNNEKDPTGR